MDIALNGSGLVYVMVLLWMTVDGCMWLLLLFNGSGFVYLVGIALDGCGLAYEYCFGCQWFVVSGWYCL